MNQRSLTESLEEVLAVFDGAEEPWTTPEVTDCLDISRRTAYNRLERLVEHGHLKTKKVGASARVWWRPQTSIEASDGKDTQVGQPDQVASWQQQFHSLVEATDEYAIFLLDPDGYIQTWNPGAARIKGYDAENILDEHFSIFYTEEDRASGVPAKNLRAAAHKGSIQDEGWRVRDDGSRFWANVTITAIHDDEGTLTGYAKVTRDMTDRREYEQQLREGKAFIESLLDTQQDILYAVDMNGQFLRWNDRFREVTGYGDAEIEEMQLVDIIADRATAETTDAISQVLDHGDSVTVELPLVTADGDEVLYEFTGGPITDETDEITGFTGIGRDISDRKAREHQLERQRDNLQAELNDIFTRIDEAFFALDTDWRITYVNDRAAELVELPVGELLQTCVWDVLPEVAERHLRESAEQAVDTQEPDEFEFYSESLDSWIEVRVYPSETGVSAYVRDITERKERERTLEEARRRYRTLVENFPNGAVTLVDENLCYRMVGGSPLEAADATVEQLEESPLRDILPPEVANVLVPRYEAALDGDPSSFESDIGDRCYHFHILPVRDDDGNVFAAMGMSQDVTERVRREEEFKDRVRQQDVVADLGQRALEEPDLEALLADAAELVAETLDTDYCKVLDLDADAEELLLRQGVGWNDDIVGEVMVSAIEDDSQAAYTLATEEPVLVGDLTTESRFSGPALLRNHDVRSGISTIIGPVDDPWGILGTHDSECREFSTHDATFVQAVANILAAAIDRHQHEQKLLHQREELVALNSLNTVVRDITNAVIDQSTRDEIEETVCERLVATDSYLFAWTGDVDANSQTVITRAEAGVEGYLEDITISVDPTDERSEGATGRALRTGEVQVTYDLQDDPRYDPWRDSVEEYNFRSSAAVPIVHENAIYGVLNIYAERPNAFTGQERSMLTQLGEVIGHAIGAAEQKQALMSDELVELEFKIEDVFEAFDVPVTTDGTITLDHTVAVGDERFLVYGTATPDALETIRSLVETVPHWERVTIRSEGDPTHFELQLTDPPVLSVVASHGGYVDDAVITDGDYRMTIHLAPTVEVRRVIETVKEAYSGAEMVRRQQITQVNDDPRPLNRQLIENLTDRQRSALEAAYHAGFFEWPRDASGEDVAESLGVTSPTFHQHLRKAERKMFEAVFSTPLQNTQTD